MIPGASSGPNDFHHQRDIQLMENYFWQHQVSLTTGIHQPQLQATCNRAIIQCPNQPQVHICSFCTNIFQFSCKKLIFCILIKELNFILINLSPFIKRDISQSNAALNWVSHTLYYMLLNKQKLHSLLCALEQADFVLPVLYTTKLSRVRKFSWVPILNCLQCSSVQNSPG